MATVSPSTGFQPYVPASQSPAEFTLKAIVIGAIFGLIFGASTVYLGLRAGLTVSASIPIAVLAISVLKKRTGVHERTIRRLLQAGELSAVGRGRLTRIALRDIAAYQQRNRR